MFPLTLCAIAGGLGLLVGFVVGHKTGESKERQRNLTPKPLRRRGVMSTQLVGSGALNKDTEYFCTLLVTELEDLGNGYSRIEIEEVTGLNDKHLKDQAKSLVGTVVRNDRIEWSDPFAPLNESDMN